MPLDYLSCFADVLRGIHRGIYICKVIIVFCPNLEFSPYSEVIHGGATFKLMKDQQRLKQNDQQFKLMFLFFLSFSSFQCPYNKCHKQKWHMLFFTRIKLVPCVLACVHVITYIKWKRLPLTLTLVGGGVLL